VYDIPFSSSESLLLTNVKNHFKCCYIRPIWAGQSQMPSLFMLCFLKIWLNLSWGSAIHIDGMLCFGKTSDIIKCMYTNKCVVKIDKKHPFFPGLWGETWLQLKPHRPQHIYLLIAMALQHSTKISSQMSKVCWWSGALVANQGGPTAASRSLQSFCQTWALTVNLSETKIIMFRKRTS
jgi:hypothetical protein